MTQEYGDRFIEDDIGDIPRVQTLNELIPLLRLWARDERAVVLGERTLAPGALSTLADALTLPTVEGRMAKAEQRGLDPLGYVVAGQLVQLGIPKPHARDDAFLLLEKLAVKDHKTPDRSPQENVVPAGEILTRDTLNSAMELASVYGAVEGSVADQLSDQFRLAYEGLIVTPQRGAEDPEELGFALPYSLLTILEALKYPESGDILKEWILEKTSSYTANDCIAFLKTLAQFSAFLDSRAYVQLYATGKNREIPLLPFQSLYRAVSEAKKVLKRSNVTDKIVRHLEQVETSIITRFNQIIRGPLKDATSVSAVEALAPSVDDLVFSFAEWSSGNASKRLSARGKALYGVKFLEQLGVVPEIERFCSLLSEEMDEEQLAAAVRAEAIRMNLLHDRQGETLKALTRDTLASLIDHRNRDSVKWRDASRIDFAQIVRPETEILEIYMITGTFGPFSQGHRDLLDRVRSYVRYRNEQDNGADHTQRLILLVPITHTETLRGYYKDPAQTGTIYERVGSMLLHMADVPTGEVFITTRLQPPPNQAGNVYRGIHATANNLTAKIENDFKHRNMAAGIRPKVIVTVGVDEFGWKNTEEGHEITPSQPKKISAECLAVGRYGYLVDCIRGARGITEYTGATLVLTQGTPRTSSTDSVKRLHLGDTSSFCAPAVPFISAHWSTEAISKRRALFGERHSNSQQDTRVPSVNEISVKLIEEYRSLTQDSTR